MFTDYSSINDKAFFKKLDADRNKVFYVEIEVLNMDERPVESGKISGRISTGSINIDGSSSVRRTCNMTFITDENRAINDYSMLLSISRKIRLNIGIENHVNKRYGEIIGFPQGIMVINQISCSHSTSGITVQMSCKDKMCLLNGDCGGSLPTSVTFDSYDQMIGVQEIGGKDELPDPRTELVNEYTVYKYRENGTFFYKVYSPSMFSSYPKNPEKWYITAKPPKSGEYVTIENYIYDIIQTAVCNFGKEDLSRIFINDLDLKLKQLSRWTGRDDLYFNAESKLYTTDKEDIEEGKELNWRVFTYGQDVGYEWVNFVYPGELVTAIGDNVCSVLDKIVSVLGNYEYFYDTYGNFIFQEKRNFLNNSYDPTIETRLDVLTGKIISRDGHTIYLEPTEESQELRPVVGNDLCIIDTTNYFVNFSESSKSVYTFDKNSGLATAYTNSPIYSNVKNDYHIWGKNGDEAVIHYHLAIKEKPIPQGYDEKGNPFYNTYKVGFYNDSAHLDGQLYIDPEGEDYTAKDWRAELYLQGLSEKYNQQRPDIYKQELLDLFDGIYNFKEQSFRTDLLNSPNELTYWIDYLDTVDGLEDYSVDAIGTRIKSHQADSVVRMFDEEAPDIMIIDVAGDASTRAETIARCLVNGQDYTNVSHDVYSKIVPQTIGYSAQEICRDLLYQYTVCSNTISISAAPVYNLEPNTRITVRDPAANIEGDYVISTISLPLDAKNQMNISATKVLERL